MKIKKPETNAELIQWGVYACTPRQGEDWDEWLDRIRFEWEELHSPDNNSLN
jgi:hypothetical protein